MGKFNSETRHQIKGIGSVLSSLQQEVLHAALHENITCMRKREWVETLTNLASRIGRLPETET